MSLVAVRLDTQLGLLGHGARRPAKISASEATLTTKRTTVGLKYDFVLLELVNKCY